MKHFDEAAAEHALSRWPHDAGTLRHLATSGNAVYAFDSDGEPRILRLSDPAYRPSDQITAEMEFLQHLEARDVRVAGPIPSHAARLVEVFDDFAAGVFAWAPGEVVAPDSPRWDEAFFRTWGRSLAEIHAAAATYAGRPRWEWRQDPIQVVANTGLSAGDAVILEALADVLQRVDAVPQNVETFGMIHADFAPQNFHYDAEGNLTAFDFGNCCMHWYAADVAISLSVLRRRADRDRLRDWLLAGYAEVLDLEFTDWSQILTFMELRRIYVYASRVMKFGPKPGEEERRTLAMLRDMVLEPLEWEAPASLTQS